ncbi:patatin-like phospholipase family protein [Methylocystis bryophila]|uniref:patatin-like phospholipase family protein n=1 Tax=Methylocystis bryophila TaxID=655015 RepID=UPI001FDA83E6|nr:patatin-like phospholipase family protein [Methylocystis bryophila]
MGSIALARPLRRSLGWGLVLAVASLLIACSSLDGRNAVPPAERAEALVLGLPNARFFMDEPKAMAAEQQRALLREARQAGARKGGELPTAYLLSLSGGGDNGAFGAGLLVGWTAHGDRPKFKLVTGVSTGALIAPFAFLGPEYDGPLTEVYTTIDPEKVFEKRFLPVAALAQDALSSTHPLYELISHYVDEPLLARIAAEYEKGRLLLIQTTDLDAGRPVIWNIGAIAASGRPEAIDLVRHILLASASIPAAFPPVMFDVEAAGKPYQEMHVDGGAVSQAFLVPPSLNTITVLRKEGYRRNVVAYVIRNGRLVTEWTDVEKLTLSIAEKAVSTMINYNGVGDLYRIYLQTQRSKAAFNLAYIGEDFRAPHPYEFDTAYMRALYDYAFAKASKGYSWRHAPPGFEDKKG